MKKMQLSRDEIQSITKGAVYLTEETDGIFFHRFTKEEEELYKEKKPWHYHSTQAPAGVKLLFTTNSETLYIKITVEDSEERPYFSLDVLLDGKVVGYIDNFDEDNLVEDFVHAQFASGEFEKEFSLGKGNKTVCVHLPWSTAFCLTALCLDDGAAFAPVQLEKKLLLYGDSITQGYHALRGHFRYAARLSEALSAEELNKGIGGANFFPELAEQSNDFVPDYITVAYGTNDWCIREKDEFAANCESFYKTLSARYSKAKIFAITPIWRINHNEDQKMGPFTLIEETIRQVVEDLPNVTVIRGFDLVPGDAKYFADGRVHPNDEGFEFYFKNLYHEIKKYL